MLCSGPKGKPVIVSAPCAPITILSCSRRPTGPELPYEIIATGAMQTTMTVSIFIMVVYDRVLPNEATESLFALNATGFARQAAQVMIVF